MQGFAQPRNALAQVRLRRAAEADPQLVIGFAAETDDVIANAKGKLKQPTDARFATNPNVPAPGFNLYRFSKGHGGLQCEACHGSTHAEYTSSHDGDNVQSIETAYGEVIKEFGRIDAAAHIGGFSWRGDTLDVTEEQWDTVVNDNLRGCFFCCQQAIRAMYEQGSGAIVNMSADAAF